MTCTCICHKHKNLEPVCHPCNLKNCLNKAACYMCNSKDDLSIKKHDRKGNPVFICKKDRREQSQTYRDKRKGRYIPEPSKPKSIGWTEAWVKNANNTIERISRKYA